MLGKIVKKCGKIVGKFYGNQCRKSRKLWKIVEKCRKFVRRISKDVKNFGENLGKIVRGISKNCVIIMVEFRDIFGK